MTERKLLDDGYRYALSLIKDPLGAEDLVHDAWVKLYEKKRELTKALFFVTIKNLFIDRYRQKKFFVLDGAEDIIDTLSDTSTLPDRDFVEEETMTAALENLRIEERECIVLNVVHGYTAQEISTFMKCSRNTVLSLMHRGKKKLKVSLVNLMEKNRVSKETVQ